MPEGIRGRADAQGRDRECLLYAAARETRYTSLLEVHLP